MANWAHLASSVLATQWSEDESGKVEGNKEAIFFENLSSNMSKCLILIQLHF